MSLLSPFFMISITWIVLVSFSHISTMLDPTGTMKENIFVFV